MFNRWVKLPYAQTLIVGPRRSGKTTLLKQNYSDFKYITLDDFDYLTWARKDPKGLIASLGDSFVIDEIQRVPELTISVKLAIDERGVRVLMTGSSSLGLLSSSADTLAGRIAIVHLPTACWGESEGEPTHRIFEDELSPFQINEAQRSLDYFMEFGGFPEVVSQFSALDAASVLRRYRDSYFTRDLAQLSNIENIEGLLAVLNHLARSVGSYLEVSNFAREAALSFPTAKKYLNVLSQSDLSFKLYGYQYGPAKRLAKAAKIYFADNGMFRALNQEISPGQRLENFVISELEKRRKLGFIKAENFFYYSTTSGREIDLLFEEADTLNLIEIKTATKIGPKHIRNLLDYAASTKNRKLKMYIFYLGHDYLTLDSVRCLPASSLYRGV